MELLQLALMFVTGAVTALTIGALSSYYSGYHHLSPRWYSTWCNYWFTLGRGRRLVDESRTASKFRTTDIPVGIRLDGSTPERPRQQTEQPL